MENGESAQSNLKLPTPDKLTLKWLWENIPFGYWGSLLGFLLLVFSTGVYMGQIGWVKYLFHVNQTNQPAAKIISETPPKDPQINTDKQTKGAPTNKPSKDAKAPKDPQIKIDQQTKGDQSQNIVTGGNVNIQINNKEKK